ncbi:serine/threonine/tyrosine-interacting-like protein 1 [Babylonia areolata]|uniref:serine/threonine/tyrosine-interacting-like protein 1 n=1 Tax=Babylonia areolata TaxID=304850 RepID=UPI003FD252DF
MADVGLKLIEPSALFNMLQQGLTCSRLSDPNYLLLIDARKKAEFNEDHVMTAKKAPRTVAGYFTAPYDAELECKQNVVVYDWNALTISDTEAPAVQCGRILWIQGSRNPVIILRGGYVEFSALYPFLRTQKVIYMPRELDEIQPYPVEVVQGFLYMGTRKHAHLYHVHKDLKIKAHINTCVEKDTLYRMRIISVRYRVRVVAVTVDGVTDIGFKDDEPVLHFPVVDNNDADLFPVFEQACCFLDDMKKQEKAVLVFSDLGISRSATVVLAYLMKHDSWPLELAYQHLQECQNALRPNRAFVDQLSVWEEMMFGARSTNVEDPNF